MRESDTFTGFVVGHGPDGRPCATFSLAWPDWPTVAEEGGSPVRESIFDPASLPLRIENLQSQGLDTSVSRAALVALRHLESSYTPERAFRPDSL